MINDTVAVGLPIAVSGWGEWNYADYAMLCSLVPKTKIKKRDASPCLLLSRRGCAHLLFATALLSSALPPRVRVCGLRSNSVYGHVTCDMLLFVTRCFQWEAIQCLDQSVKTTICKTMQLMTWSDHQVCLCNLWIDDWFMYFEFFKFQDRAVGGWAHRSQGHWNHNVNWYWYCTDTDTDNTT